MHIKRTLQLMFICLSLSFTAIAQNNVLGKWLTQNKDGVVEIYKKGDKYYGKIVKLIPATNPDGSAIIDQNNPDKTKQSRPVLGINTIIGFTWDGEELVDGQVYDPNDGKFYKGKIWAENGNLKMRGYIGFLYRTETWTKIK